MGFSLLMTHLQLTMRLLGTLPVVEVTSYPIPVPIFPFQPIYIPIHPFILLLASILVYSISLLCMFSHILIFSHIPILAHILIHALHPIPQGLAAESGVASGPLDVVCFQLAVPVLLVGVHDEGVGVSDFGVVVEGVLFLAGVGVEGVVALGQFDQEVLGVTVGESAGGQVGIGVGGRVALKVVLCCHFIYFIFCQCINICTMNAKADVI